MTRDGEEILHLPFIDFECLRDRLTIDDEPFNLYNFTASEYSDYYR